MCYDDNNLIWDMELIENCCLCWFNKSYHFLHELTCLSDRIAKLIKINNMTPSSMQFFYVME
jgi:hypothetical protein